MIYASVIICTYNPREDHLTRALDALQSQTLPSSHWELLIVDNASDHPISERFELSWHPRGCHIREDELGLTAARLRGIAESNGDLLIFVDDDNILDSNYIERAVKIGREYAFLGAWGGTIRAEFENAPADWTRRHWGNLAIREFDRVVWSNNPEDWLSQPCGAGLCVRRVIARHYREQLVVDPVRRALGRKGTSLLSTEDTDMILTSSEFDLGWGNFPHLRLLHLIPAFRLTESYLLKLTEGMAASSTALAIRRGGTPLAPVAWKTWMRWVFIRASQGRRSARFYRAAQKGRTAGFAFAKDSNRSSNFIGRALRLPTGIPIRCPMPEDLPPLPPQQKG